MPACQEMPNRDCPRTVRVCPRSGEVTHKASVARGDVVNRPDVARRRRSTDIGFVAAPLLAVWLVATAIPFAHAQSPAGPFSSGRPTGRPAPIGRPAPTAQRQAAGENRNAAMQDALEAAAEIELPSDPATVIAVVGQSRILLGDLMPKVDAQLSQMIERSPQPVPKDQIEPVKVMMLRGLLRQTISNKMMRESFLLEQVATQAADKRREAAETMASRARQMFSETRIPELQEKLGTQDLNEIDSKLREQGSSLQSLQSDFIDQMLGMLYRRSKVDPSPKVSLAEIYEHYTAHPDQYHHGARARWEQLTVRFENFPTRDAAKAAIWKMLQEARFGGSMRSVAREKSQEPFAKRGGVHGWTTEGSLASEPLDRAIFDSDLPLDEISDVIADDDAFHVIRVLEREPAGLTPVADVQEKIREKIKQKKIAEAEDRVLEEIQDRVPVWSFFPDDIPGAMPLPRVAGRPDATRR